jgi:DNA polymerase IV
VADAGAPEPGGVWPAEAGRCTVLHVDMDAFFAAVEVLDDPTLAGKPVIVGGSGARGVVASCTYEARAYGIHSAMPSVQARRRCPHAVFVSGRYRRYAEMSERLHDVLHRFSPAVEGIGLDEAFVDVSGVTRLMGSPPVLARRLRQEVCAVLELDCAVGVARTKLLAKLASRAAKPVPSLEGPQPGPGVVVVLPSAELAFLHPLPVRALWGVGPATAARLETMGVSTVADLARIPAQSLCRALGTAHGRALATLARGEDPRRVEPDRDAKSVGHEETFATDLRMPDALHTHVVRMADAVATRLREAHLEGRTITVKVRYGDRTTITRSQTVGAPVDSPRAVAAVAQALLDAVDVSTGVRLLGVSVSGLRAAVTEARQLSFDDTEAPAGPAGAPGTPPDPRAPRVDDAGPARARAEAWAEVEAAVSAVRARYGNGSVGPGTLVGRGGITVKERGDTQWGPSAPAPGDVGAS